MFIQTFYNKPDLCILSSIILNIFLVETEVLIIIQDVSDKPLSFSLSLHICISLFHSLTLTLSPSLSLFIKLPFSII